MTRWCPRALLLALVTLGGCIDYLPMHPDSQWPEPMETTMMVLSLTHSAREDSVHVHAGLYAGEAPRGQPRKVSDERLHVGGRVLLPVQRERAWLGYDGIVAADGALLVKLPTVAGTRDSPGTLMLTQPVRTGPAEVPIHPGGETVLRLRPGGLVPEPTQRNWHLFLSARSGAAMIQREGAVPDSIRISPEVLPGGGAETVQATLMVITGLHDAGDVDYLIRATFAWELTWTLVPAAP